MIKSKKGAIPMYDVMFMLFISMLFLGSLVYFFIGYDKISTDDKKLQTQIITNKIQSECFTNEYGKIDYESLEYTNLDSCLKGIDEKNQVRVNIADKTIFLRNNKAGYEQLANFCTVEDSLECLESDVPVLLTKDGKDLGFRNLRVQLIVT